MNRIVGIRWRKCEPVVYADAGDLAMKRNTMVVQAVKGRELGLVVREWPLAEVERSSTSRNRSLKPMAR